MSERISIYLNGERREIPSARSLPELIELLGLPLAAALVEHNGRALLRSEWQATRIAEDDRIEILRIVAGG